VERTHRIDDEEFYCPRGEFIDSKQDFLEEAQLWIMYYNNRISDGIGLEGITPREKLVQLGYQNAKDICNFPCFILEDYYKPFRQFFEIKKSQNVLTHYPIKPRSALPLTFRRFGRIIYSYDRSGEVRCQPNIRGNIP